MTPHKCSTTHILETCFLQSGWWPSRSLYYPATTTIMSYSNHTIFFFFSPCALNHSPSHCELIHMSHHTTSSPIGISYPYHHNAITTHTPHPLSFIYVFVYPRPSTCVMRLLQTWSFLSSGLLPNHTSLLLICNILSHPSKWPTFDCFNIFLKLNHFPPLLCRISSWAFPDVLQWSLQPHNPVTPILPQLAPSWTHYAQAIMEPSRNLFGSHRTSSEASWIHLGTFTILITHQH